MTEAALGRFTFEVNIDSDKNAIKKAVREAFKVNPQEVQTITVSGKTKRSMRSRKMFKGSDWKKAIVKLKTGEKIDLFDVSEGGKSA